MSASLLCSPQERDEKIEELEAALQGARVQLENLEMKQQDAGQEGLRRSKRVAASATSMQQELLEAKANLEQCQSELRTTTAGEEQGQGSQGWVAVGERGGRSGSSLVTWLCQAHPFSSASVIVGWGLLTLFLLPPRATQVPEAGGATTFCQTHHCRCGQEAGGRTEGNCTPMREKGRGSSGNAVRHNLQATFYCSPRVANNLQLWGPEYAALPVTQWQLD